MPGVVRAGLQPTELHLVSVSPGLAGTATLCAQRAVKIRLPKSAEDGTRQKFLRPKHW